MLGVRPSFLTGSLLLLSLLLACDGDPLFAPSAALVRPPATLTASAVSPYQINLTWQDNSPNETGFELYRSTPDPSGPFTRLATAGANATTYGDAGLTQKTQYCYQVRAFKTSGPNTSYSPFSQTACATTPGPPAAPSNANATPLNSQAVDLTWSDNSGTEDGFRLERGASSEGPWAEIAKTAPNVTSYRDEGRTSEQVVCYQVIAFNTYGASEPSNADCTAPPAAPSGLTATATQDQAIDLAWVDNSQVEDGYEVERSRGVAAWSVIAVLPANATSYRDGGVTANVRYEYRVRATKDQGYSSFSNDASALIPISVSQSSLIAFSSDRDGDFAIFLMNPDGSGVTRLTDPLVRNAGPSWSPDGARIAFGGDAYCFRDIYVMNRDGSMPTPLTSCEGVNRFPAWSPDGQHIVFASDRDAVCTYICGDDIYVMDTDGSNVRRLTDNPGEDWLPAWSPDGARIAFSSDRDGTYPALDIYVMNTDGSGVVRLTYDAAFNIDPAWSPDGSKIAFSSSRDGFNEIWVMNADGTGLARLTGDQGYDIHPTWSPDGTRLAFMRAALQCDYDYCYIVGASIAVMGADGGGLVNLTDGSAEDGEPSWGRSVGGSMTATALKGGSRTARVGRTERAPRVRLDARRTGVDAKGMRRAVRVPADSRPTR